MAARLVLLLLLQHCFLSAQSQSPESFSIGELHGNEWHVTDVQPVSSSETRVRFIRVYRSCGTYHVNEAEHVFEATVQELASSADLCISDKQFKNAIRSVTRKHAEDYGRGQNISVRCGSSMILRQLPDPSLLHYEELQAEQPAVAALYNLTRDLRTSFSKETGQDIFSCSQNCDKFRLEQRGALEQAAADIRSGKYDLILPPIPRQWQTDTESGLSLAMPSPQEAADPDKDRGTVDEPEQLGVETAVEVQYPQMGRIAHIEGDVTAELSVDSASGKVLAVESSSGHPILRAAVTEAANKWVFLHPYFGPNPVTILVHFKLHCPVPIDTSKTVVSIHKSRVRLAKNNH